MCSFMCSSMISIAIIDNEKEDVSGGQSLKARLVTMARKALQVESPNETSGKFARKKSQMRRQILFSCFEIANMRTI